jgi:ribosomal protein L37E
MLSEFRRCPTCQKIKHEAMFRGDMRLHEMCHPCRMQVEGPIRREKIPDWRNPVAISKTCNRCGEPTTNAKLCTPCGGASSRSREATRKRLKVIKGGKA